MAEKGWFTQVSDIAAERVEVISRADDLVDAAKQVLNCMAQGQTSLDDMVMSHDSGCLQTLAAYIQRYDDARKSMP